MNLRHSKFIIIIIIAEKMKSLLQWWWWWWKLLLLLLWQMLLQMSRQFLFFSLTCIFGVTEPANKQSIIVAYTFVYIWECANSCKILFPKKLCVRMYENNSDVAVSSLTFNSKVNELLRIIKWMKMMINDGSGAEFCGRKRRWFCYYKT